MARSYVITMVFELCHGVGYRSMKSAGLPGQSSLRSVWSATEYDSEDLTRFSRQRFAIDLYPARNSTVRIGIPA